MAVNSAGYANAQVIGRGNGAADALFVLTASRGDSAFVLVTVEPEGSAAHPIVIERGAAVADLGVRAVSVSPFLGIRDLVDVEVVRGAQSLEFKLLVSTHYLIRREGEGLYARCEFDGDATTTSATSIRSDEWVRYVTVDPVAGQPISFMVSAIEKTLRSRDRAQITTVDSTLVTRRYELQPTGTCRVLKPE